MPVGTEIALGQGHILLHGDPDPPPTKRGTATTATVAVYSPRQACVHKPRPISIVAKRLDGSRCHLLRSQTSAQVTFCYMGTSSLPTERGTASPTHFSAHVRCGQTNWINQDTSRLGTEIDLHILHYVRWRPSSSTAAPSNFRGLQKPASVLRGACVVWRNGSVDQDTT